ncbi:hypothetical protein [Ideonella sp.]|uniref:hypothetical protein n=1 Tax=Ideonella sp. TaxID=1929293 RepID=UPI002B4A1B7B|nr:hypothetical protein [Ideonella sp.]HJV72323.1 hypothetical protein [Ideonella sp.]
MRESAPRRGRAAVVLAALGLATAMGQTARSIVDLQPARRSESVVVQEPAGPRVTLTLTQLNPAINAWLLLSVQRPPGAEAERFHLENADPARQRLTLDAAHPGQIEITTGARSTRCTLWPGDALAQARRQKLPYAPLCDGRVYLRNTVQGNRTTLEATTEFLRDHVWRGEQIIGFVRRELYQDAFIERATPALAADAAPPAPRGAPAPARMAASAARQALQAEGLGIDLGLRGAGMWPGRWYAAAGLEGIFVSAVQAGSVEGAGPAARPLDPVEATALSYLVAFDLASFDLGFALGTEHPRLGWSARVPDELRDAAGPGPDGIESAAPLVRTGMVAPALEARVVATFTGGFKREHGAFRHGALAAAHRGSHYGFIEQGVVFSTLVPGLSTLYVLDDGQVGMTTWRPDDDRLLGRIRHARQNGVPLIERDPAGGVPRPGALVDQWGAGNWSGSSDEKLRTLRAGACLLEGPGGRRHLVYGYFSSATPRAMARVFGAYGCSEAMHLDMNALEHTYLALYPRRGAQLGVEHLVTGMSVLDKSVGPALVPRFLGFADDRDFFYLVRKDSP